MTKTEIMAALKAKGIFEVSGSRDPLWQEAFKLHYAETRVKLSQSCGGCFNRVRNWLKS